MAVLVSGCMSMPHDHYHPRPAGRVIYEPQGVPLAYRVYTEGSPEFQGAFIQGPYNDYPLHFRNGYDYAFFRNERSLAVAVYDRIGLLFEVPPHSVVYFVPSYESGWIAVRRNIKLVYEGGSSRTIQLHLPRNGREPPGINL